MKCKDCRNEMADWIFEPESAVESPAIASQRAQFTAHLAACPACSEEMSSLMKTMDVLDAWHAPEPSAYFDQKLAVLLREEQSKAPASWLERIREHLLFNTGRQFRPALVGALALVLILSGGSYFGVNSFNQPAQVQASAAVNDLQILDKNDQAIQQMDQLLQDDDSGDSNTPAQPAS